MFVEVPLPVWKMSRTNWSSQRPAITSSAACTTASATRVELVQLHVRLRRGLLDHAERGDEPAREPQVADRKVLHRPLRLRRVQRVGRHAHLAQRVALGPEARFVRHGRPSIQVRSSLRIPSSGR
jgi:hypothetical protein